MSARTVEQAAAIVELSNALGKWKVTNDAINACLEYLQANYPKLFPTEEQLFTAVNSCPRLTLIQGGRDA